MLTQSNNVKNAKQFIVPHMRGTVKSLSRAATIVLGLGTISTFGYAIAQGSISVLVTFVLFGVSGSLVVSRCGRPSINLFLLSYGLVSFFSVVLYYIYNHRYGLPYFIGGSDDLSYELDAILVSKFSFLYNADTIKWLIEKPFHNSTGYIYIVSLLVALGDSLGGYDTLIPRIFNGAALGLTAVLVSRVAILMRVNDRWSIISGVWVIIFPIMFYSASHLFREAITGLILMLMLYHSLKICSFSDKKYNYFLLFHSVIPCILILVMLEFRYLYVIPMTMMLLTSWAVVVLPINKIRAFHLALIGPLVALLILVINELGVFIQGYGVIEVYADELSSGDRGGVDGLSLLLFNLPEPYQSVARFIYALITPLPVPNIDLERNLLGIGALVQFYYSTFVILGLKLMWRDPRYLPVLFGFCVIFYSYMMGTFTFRHITQWFPFAVLIGVVGYCRYRAYKRVIFIFCTSLVGLASITYYSLKYI